MILVLITKCNLVNILSYLKQEKELGKFFEREKGSGKSSNIVLYAIFL